MALITPSSFDPLKTRCNVRLQQGVPIVDADWNELDDIRKFELRAYLKWFVGDGVPDGNDGFRIDAILVPLIADDFIIRAGALAPAAGTSNAETALRNVGRCIIDGLDVLIAADVNYKAQALSAGPGPGGLKQIQPIPNAAGPVAIYLDVWERVITSQEDPSLVLPGIGVESAARMKREWCVRTRVGSAAPKAGDADFVAGHSYYVLAVLNRKMIGGNPAPVTAADISDSRHGRLSLAAMERRLATLEQLLLTPSFAASPNQFNPKLGAPGAIIALFGSNLNIGAVSVRFGATAATLSGLQSSSQVNAVVPAGLAPGQVKITLQTSGGTIVTDDNFTVLPLAPSFAASPNQFNPKIGSIAGGTQIALFGTNFNQTPVTVLFGAAQGQIVGAPTAAQINVIVPTAAAGAVPGPVKITVQTAAGQTISADSFALTP